MDLNVLGDADFLALVVVFKHEMSVRPLLSECASFFKNTQPL